MKNRYTLIAIALGFVLVLVPATNTLAQNVNIPDATFKSLLVADVSINTSGDGEIQVAEAAAFTGSIDAGSLGINDLTGIEAFTALTSLDCGYNTITSLDLTSNTALTFLDCSNNGLTSLDISGLTSLANLYAGWNSLTCLDVSTNTALTNVNCPYNNLTSLNLKNGNNGILATMSSLNNGMLYCIQVDNVAQATAASWAHDTWSAYNTDCGQPTASFISNAPVCCGSPIMFTDQSTAETSWHWDFGDGFTSTMQNPTHTYLGTGDFIVSLIAKNCNGADTTGLTVVQGMDILGNVSYSGGNVTSGVAILYPYLPFYTSFDTLDIRPLDGSGNYQFANVSQGDYLVKIFPDTTAYPTLISTYYNNAWAWDSAMVFTHVCLTDGFANVVMEELPVMTGPGLLNGTVIQGPGFGRAPGEPVHGVDIKLGITGASQIVATTTTDTTGEYTFTNVAPGDYTVYVDIPGLERISVFMITVDTTNYQFLNLDYLVDSVSIYIVPNIGIEDHASTDHAFEIYPNPVNESATIAYEISSDANVRLDVYNIYGVKVYSLVNTHQESGEYYFNFNPKNHQLKPGVYFISLSTNGKSSTKRIIVID